VNFEKTIFAQLMDFLPIYEFHQYVKRYHGHYKMKSFSCCDQYITLPALTIAKLFQCRWQIEIFFKWIKQHLHIKGFYGTTENAVKSEIWIAIAVFVLVAIVKKQLHLDSSLYTILQILSVTLF